jgi:hypothetical protein
MAVSLSADEIRCVKKLAVIFTSGDNPVQCNASAGDFTDADLEPLGVTKDNRDAVLAMMEELNAIRGVSHNALCRYSWFEVSPKAVQIARAIEAEEAKKGEPGDFVAKVTEGARKRPVLGAVIIAFLVLTAAATLANQTVQFLQNMGWMAKPQP